MSVTETAFSQLMAIAGRERPSNVTFEEGPPALKSKFADDEAVSAVIAAGASVAADLWRLKGGAEQEVRVNTREGGAALTGYTSTNYFVNVFKKYVCAYPSRYRLEHKGGV